jgi:hypothetical protein
VAISAGQIAGNTGEEIAEWKDWMTGRAEQLWQVVFSWA